MVKQNEKDFYAGICVALQIVAQRGECVIWREIAGSVSEERLRKYVTEIEPTEYEVAGFSRFAKTELGW
ncbi:hypothetical protein Selin_1445 [Desulfurispirillum indicum S5]|uniref:Uncharacterized protein n=1 Tax=Desulfurispirillum indicum (strain ATCC BAA-1389 / DSM 22839 / S5) TaxID=653733 RepID=E6W6T6_DESIS|nr:hypothetical protein [Desulfurispirillum indicum]ADU66179.1 hypothetical protein Selin_1445 [Desulfurispirillum indicum S5]